MASSLKKMPVRWDGKGKVLQWAQYKDGRKSLDGKSPMSWRGNEEEGGKVTLWAYTKPTGKLDFIQWEKLTPIQRARFERQYHSGERERFVKKFYLGRVVSEDERVRMLVSMVDSIQRMDSSFRCKRSPWGDLPPLTGEGMQRHFDESKDERAFVPLPSEIVRPTREAMRLYLKHKNRMFKFFGKCLFGMIADRDLAIVGSMMRVLETGKDICLDDHWYSDQGVWSQGDSFEGTVYRCWRILEKWNRYNGLPTKATLREYVRQEWEAMGHTSSTVSSEFSDALKVLGLSGLPNAARGRSVVNVRRAKLQK
jgi:hypothetical protein